MTERGSSAVQFREEAVPVGLADGLDHLNGDDRIELSDELPVVGQAHVDEVGQVFLGDQTPRVCGLLVGEGHRRHPAPAALCGVDGQGTPAGADLEQVGVGVEVELVEQEATFAYLGILEGVAGCEHDAGVGHRSVQEQCDQLVAEVVVGTDVA